MASTVTVDNSSHSDAPATSASERTLRLRGVRITLRGVLCITITLLVGLAALNGEANLLFLLFSIGIGAIAFNAFAAISMLQKIEVDRSVPQSLVAGRAFSIVYTVRSQRRWGRAWSLVVSETPLEEASVELPLGFIPCLPAGQTQRLELIGKCMNRGHIALRGVRLQCRFPFGLFSCTVDLKQTAELIVYPALGWLRRDAWRNRRFCEASTSKKIHHHRGMDEFYGVREYRDGDSFRWIHWRRSAHAGQLVIRESAPLRASQMIVLLDPWPTTPHTHHPDGPDRDAERVISAAATAACDSLERGHRVGLIVRARIPIVIPPAQGRPHRRRLLHELAAISPGQIEPMDEMIARVRWTGGWHARCLICTARLAESHSRVMRFLGTRAESIMVAAPGSDWLEGVFAPLSEPGMERRTA